jgi:hypothetical protein
MTVTIDNFLFGPPSAQSFGGTPLGQGDQDAKVVIKETRSGGFRPQGAAAPLVGTDRIISSEAAATVTLSDLSLAVLQMILHNVTPVVGTAATTTGSGLATTLAADAAAGATSIVLTAATNIADNKFLKVGDAGETEIVEVDPSWTAGTTIPLTTPLVRAHDAGDAVVMVDDAGTTILQQRTGLISAASHKNFVFQAVNPAGVATLVTIFGALSGGNLDITLGEKGPNGTPVTFTGYSSLADPTLAPWSMEKLTV